MSSTAAPHDPAGIASIITQYLHLEGPLLPMLHGIQEAYGCVPDDARPLIADALNITEAELHGVISFYHDFRREPAGHHVLKICRAEACQAVGANALSDKVLSMLGLDWHGTSADGRITVEPVYCLGLCACGPAAMVDGQVRGRVTAEALVQELAQ